MSAPPREHRRPGAAESAAIGWILESDARERSGAELSTFGLTPGERMRRSLARAGCAPRRVDDDSLPALAPCDRVALLRADRILDERLVRALVHAPDTWLEDEALGPLGAQVVAQDAAAAAAALRGCARAPGGLRRVTPDALVPAWRAELRKSEPPWVCDVRPERAREIERRIFDASYKGATDLVTKWVWPIPARAVTRWCAERGISPNAVTLASWVLALAVIALFAKGAFALGLLLAWLMTFLDTVDGKLARVTLTSSRLGSVLDHGLDLLHPPFWYLAWSHGLAVPSPVATAVAVGGYVVGRALEGAFLARFRIEAHSWRPIDALFRTITARRNPNLILLSVGAACGRPDLGLVMVALWTVVSVGFHSLRLAQAFAAARRGEAVVGWDASR
ncbi:MAG TPA: CDP-alcohol phosphatidyltransferase family protein [Myxococcota bacterium]|nr:CDP-alcohol phosphatidyltransferase family protein [Myxococcota bacterium]